MTAISSVMGAEFKLAPWIALSLILSCAGIASGQDASVLPPSGAGSTSSSTGSGGLGAVDYSSSSSLPLVSTNSSVANARVSAAPSALTASDLISQAGGRSSSHQTTGHLDSSPSGGNQSPSNSAANASRSGSSHSGALSSLRAAASGSSHGSTAIRSLRSSQGVPAMESGLGRYKLKSSTTSANPSITQARAGLSEGKEGRSGSGAMAESVQYPNSFPDSTKNTGVVSPPDLGSKDLFSFDPSVSAEFPDLADRHFLEPNLHVGGGGGSSGHQQKEDLYRRIEGRLKEYREAETPKNTGLKTKKRTHSSDLDHPFGTKPSVEDKLNKLSNPGSSF